MAAGEITSANVVGYMQKETPQAKFMIGTVPFETTDGTLDIQKLFTGFTPVEVNWDTFDFVNTAAQLQIWNGSNYDMAYYVTGAWVDDGTEEGKFLTDPAWCDAGGVAYEGYEFVPGGAYWVRNLVDSNPLTASGAVNDADSIPFECTTGFMLAGNPYPVAIALDSKDQMTSTDITPVEVNWDTFDFVNTATQLQIWNGSNYDMAYYVTGAWVDDGTEEGKFLTDPAWCDAGGVAYEGYSIPAGNGFWVRAVSGACTLDFINPIKEKE